MGKQRLQQFGGLRAVIFDDGDAPRQSPRLPRANSPDKFLDVSVRGQELDYQQTRLPAGEGVRVSYSSRNVRPARRSSDKPAISRMRPRNGCKLSLIADA